MGDIIIDRELLKAIGADTRISIIKALGERRKMLSELAEELGISKPTALEHLQQLERAGLIKKIDDGRKWKYYELTEKGLGLVQKSKVPVRAFIMLTISILAIATSFLLFQSALTTSEPESIGLMANYERLADGFGGAQEATKGVSSEPLQGNANILFVAGFMLLAGIVLMALAKAEFESRNLS